MDYPLIFHHIGIACKDIEKTKSFYVSMGYEATATVDDPLQHVRICFLNKQGCPRLELVEPMDEQSPVLRTLSSAGVTPYHLCYQVEDINEAISSLRHKRFVLVNGPVPACAMNDRLIAFMFNQHSGLIELVESAPR